jgi:hypothetical protein
MRRICARFEGDRQGWYPVFSRDGAPSVRISVPHPLDCSYLRGDRRQSGYSRVETPEPGTYVAGLEWTDRGIDFSGRDKWRIVDERRIRLDRILRMSRREAEPSPMDDRDGVQVHVQLVVSPTRGRSWRFFAPAQLYSQQGEFEWGRQITSFMDDRLAYPLIMGYDPDSQTGIAVSRATPATFVHAPARPHKENRYLQETDLGSLGFSFGDYDELAFDLYWPYFEGEKSVALDSRLSPAAAFYPLDGQNSSVSLSYEVFLFEAQHFGEAVLAAFRNADSLATPMPVELPFSLEEAVEYRLASLQKTYREWGHDGAAFFCSFDPRRGYGTPPTGFGTQFNTIPSDAYNRILEYGFTGRQLNAAYVLAKRCGGEWIERGKRVIDVFVSHCTQPTGWLYSLYDVSEGRPLHTFGESSRAALLHYGGYSQRPGNYVRTMVESASDLLLNYQWYRSWGRVESRWIETCSAFGHFLTQHQNADGSWFRAYDAAGEPIMGDRWFGRDERAAKSASAIPIAYLVRLGEEDKEAGAAYLQAARKAGDYVLEHHVAWDHYQGATLDNPNVIDKEAALYTNLLFSPAQSGRRSLP